MLHSIFRRLVSLGWGDEGDDELRTDGGTATATASASTGQSNRSWRDSEFVRSLPFWLPPALLMGLFVYGAIGWNAVISLTEWSGFGSPDYGDLDFSMYAQMLGDPTFVAAARNTVVLLVVFTVASLVVGLLLAILVDRGIRFENTFRTVYLLPMSLSFVVTAIFWAWMYNPEIGLINVVLRGTGLGFLANDWISDPQTKLGAVIFALMWQFSGYCMVVYLAGLRAIPSDQFEAARIDGASTVRMYWRVVIPQLRASTMSAAVVLMVFALKAFDFLFVMFGDTPGPSTDILATMMFREAFSSSNWAYGAAIATVLFLLALVVIGPYLYVQYQRGDL
ncbi:carbohydrate ABC transporter membrane protein 1, CUT1 family [Halogeometricum rufum]|uniref:Carbohydrate ABC transporter membrane protein 1, CUT1 family n=1 Tax=Halogeometricum rufum TaxID=553469 RepID=A0A1I6HFE6_9EURY|nr:MULTISPECIES: sugar ABC transporter permease [Halogeometricum]MUV57716.1 ABC transporter permease subunit [Halogeometricum sp. CBA1124]SFR53213.1 carbohydrate ABC transporter membrane protein 1, CUT1 family [Halogeometricum rufum]